MRFARQSAIASCTACPLHRNQPPLLDAPQPAQVFWVGLSAVRLRPDETVRPLGSETRSGRLLDEIEKRVEGIIFYRTNLVKCLPCSNEKLRYPSHAEMSSCFSNMETELAELSPKLVILLGKQVTHFVLSRVGEGRMSTATDYAYQIAVAGGVAYMPIHHPSYMLIYRRRDIDLYIQSICANITAIEIRA